MKFLLLFSYTILKKRRRKKHFLKFNFRFEMWYFVQYSVCVPRAYSTILGCSTIPIRLPNSNLPENCQINSTFKPGYWRSQSILGRIRSLVAMVSCPLPGSGDTCPWWHLGLSWPSRRPWGRTTRTSAGRSCSQGDLTSYWPGGWKLPFQSCLASGGSYKCPHRN